MRQWQTIGRINTTRSRKRLLPTAGVGLTLAVVGSGSVALAMHNSVGTEPNSHVNVSSSKVQIDTRQSAVSPASSLSADQPLQPDATGISTGASSTTSPDITSPGVTNTNSSSTTITVNGQTTQFTGNGSYDKSYVSVDGTTHVDISVRGSSTSDNNASKEDAMD